MLLIDVKGPSVVKNNVSAQQTSVVRKGNIREDYFRGFDRNDLAVRQRRPESFLDQSLKLTVCTKGPLAIVVLDIERPYGAFQVLVVIETTRFQLPARQVDHEIRNTVLIEHGPSVPENPFRKLAFLKILDPSIRALKNPRDEFPGRIDREILKDLFRRF